MRTIPSLCCPACGSANLSRHDALLACPDCGQVYPIVGGVPVMFEDVSVLPGKAADPDVVAQILRVFELPSDALSVMKLRDTTRMKVRFGGSLIQAESVQFLDRVRNTGHTIAASDVNRETRNADDPAAVPRIAWRADYIPRRLPVGCELLANIRFENVGGGALRREGPNPATLAVAWHTPAGAPVEVEELRTPLPVDVVPGQGLTVAIKLRTPSRPGTYQLGLTVVQEGLRWLRDDSRTMFVQLDERPRNPVPAGWWSLEHPPVGYEEDHDRGLARLAGWFERFGDRPLRILEIGGNVLPMCTRLQRNAGTEIFNVDVDLLGLQVGAIYARERGQRLHVVCADAADLPFPDASFDAIVMFASLHHFPDPVALLRGLGRKLARGGFVGLLCEPVGHVWPGAVVPEFLAELEKGVNEQSFSLREYERMFGRAGFDVVEAVNDFNSLKACLVAADGATR